MRRLSLPVFLLGAAARVNITLADFDGEGVNHNTISWRPSRYGHNATAGSGTFVRQ